MADFIQNKISKELQMLGTKRENLNADLSITIRPECPEDFYAVELLTREAFWGYFNPTCNEHYLAHLLRNSSAFVPELDVVAEQDGKRIGNVMYSKATVTDAIGMVHPVLTFGPLSVLPEYWSCGIGSALMKHSIIKAKKLGYPAIVFHGHPDYYPRFGFQSAEVFGITNESGENYDALMAMELIPGALSGIHGCFAEDSVFNIREEDAVQYNERNFPPKEPARMVAIGVLEHRIPTAAYDALKQHGIATLELLNRFSGREMLRWEGMNAEALNQINQALREEGFASKLLPGCDILERAKQGINILLATLK